MGGIGIVYDGPLGAVGTWMLFIAIIILSVIGLITVLKFFLFGRRKKESKSEKWLRTGKWE